MQIHVCWATRLDYSIWICVRTLLPPFFSSSDFCCSRFCIVLETGLVKKTVPTTSGFTMMALFRGFRFVIQKETIPQSEQIGKKKLGTEFYRTVKVCVAKRFQLFYVKICRLNVFRRRVRKEFAIFTGKVQEILHVHGWTGNPNPVNPQAGDENLFCFRNIFWHQTNFRCVQLKAKICGTWTRKKRTLWI